MTAQPERLALVRHSLQFAEAETADVLESLLTAEQVAKVLGVRTKRVYELAIPAVKLSERSLRWRPSQLAAWIREREGGQ